MDVILLERVEKLGQMGDEVRVKDGFARNFLLPQKKALRATEANRKIFESQRVDLEARNLERKAEAEKVGEKLDGQGFVLIRQAGDSGQLYGSVSTRDIAGAAEEAGFKIARNQVVLNAPLKTLGLFDVRVLLHPEVAVTVQVNIARSPDEAERQARGEDLTVDKFEREALETHDDEVAVEVEEVFESEELAAQAEEQLSEADKSKAEAVGATPAEADHGQDNNA